jgi:creatinine amidohydrolase
MTAIYLDRLTWAEVKKEIHEGRSTVVVPFGSTEQHGRHLPLGTDAVLGDELGRGLAERLDAFLAPTVRLGCSAHHLSFPGTISLREETFQQIVVDVVASLSRHGFRRIVLLPTHGGNFKPLAQVFAELKPVENVRVLAFTDLEGFVEVAFESSRSAGVAPAQSGAHSGEWETFAMLALRPEQVKMDQAAEGFVGELSEILAKVFDGIQNLDENGVLGDPRPAAAAAGKKHLEDMVDFLYQWVRDQG